MRRLLRALFSRRVAVVLMLAMAAVLALASLVPEPDLADPARLAALEAKRPILIHLFRSLRPDRIAASPAFLVLPALVFASTAYSIITRVRAELARRRRGQGASAARMRFRVVRTREVAAPIDAVVEAARRTIARSGFALRDGSVQLRTAAVGERVARAASEVRATRGALG